MKYTIIFLLLAAILASSCGDVSDEDINGEITAEPELKTDIIIGVTDIKGIFSPFYTRLGTGDDDVMSLINAPLVTLDRRGEVVRNAAVGEWREFDGEEYYYEGISDVSISVTENNTTILTFELRDDILFSNGEEMNADDLIFTLYAFGDTDYKERYGLWQPPVEGIDLYRTNADAETYDKYAQIAEACLEAGSDYHIEIENDGENFDEEQYLLFYECYEEAWLSHVSAIIDFCVEEYADYAHIISSNPDNDIYEDEWMQVALAMFIWRVADFPVILPATEDSVAVYGPLTSVLGREWNLINRFPTLWDFYREFFELYDGNITDYINSEKIGEPWLDDPLREAVRLFISKSAARDPENTGTANIGGIRKTGDYTVEVTLEGSVPQAVYSFVIPVAPLHYYGEPALYNYHGNSFGFPRGDISIIRENNKPVGAGAYRYIEYSGDTVILAANEHYFKGECRIPQIIFKETPLADLIYNTASGALDIAAVEATRDALDELDAYNSAGISRQTTEYGAFGYIGLNAERVNIDGEPLSEESVNLRKGLATVFAAYRDISVRDFYGEAARIAEYPVSGVSWAAPRQEDSGYKTAFGTDADGNDIFADDMTEALRLQAAKQAALGFFERAGFVLNAGKTAVAEFPEGFENNYVVYIAGAGMGRHPSYLLLAMAADALRTAGINITITDVSSQGELYGAVMSGEADMWCAAWDGGILPETGKNFESFGEDNYFKLADEMTDQRIALAETSLNLEFYRSAFDAVLENAVCVPIYQREKYFLFGGALDRGTIEGSLTAHYNWAHILWQTAVN